MKHCLLLSILLLAASCATNPEPCANGPWDGPLLDATGQPFPEPNEIELSFSIFENQKFTFLIPTAHFKAAPKWDPKGADVPLLPGAAYRSALALAQMVRPDVRRWNLEDITLEERGACRWIYMVRLWRGDQAGGGMPFYLKVPVLMDGTAARPRIEPWEHPTIDGSELSQGTK